MIWFLRIFPASYADAELHVRTGEMLSGARRVVVKNEDVLYIGYGNGRDQGA
jgi:hypothetical protein